MTTIRAAIYARYSSELQSEASVEDQVRICKERLRREGWDLVQVFQDRALSGSNTQRAGYQALLAGARDGAFDVVVAEALDRLSRDQEDVAGLFKRLRFAGIKIITLAEGEINELHVGMKGTMNALFLRDLAAKTHRGLRGRVEAGLSGGGVTFGYRVVRRLAANGLPALGEREIDAVEAAVVLRIFRAYAAGTSPRKIALGLNADGIPAPRSGAWSASTINGNRARGTGILNNEAYIGRLVWNRLTYIRDPDTGRRRSRARQAQELIVTELPELRIVPDALWLAARARQTKLDSAQTISAEQPTTAFWSKQRPRYLFSGLMRCGICGAGYSKANAERFGCSGARNKGPTSCTNNRTIRREVLESTVIDGLRQRLMDPDTYKAFVLEFTAEWNRMQTEISGDIAARETELERTRRQIERLVDALADGTMPASAVSSRLSALETRRLKLESELVDAASPAPLLHPNLAEIYRARMATLATAIESDDAAEARDVVRHLVDSITLTPDGDALHIDIRGELANILSLANGRGAQRPEILAEQVKMVAGAGFEPTTFRL